MNFYVHDKLRELEAERTANQPWVEPPKPRRRLLVGGVVALAGHALRRAARASRLGRRPLRTRAQSG